jgi:hypothetical protein
MTCNLISYGSSYGSKYYYLILFSEMCHMLMIYKAEDYSFNSLKHLQEVEAISTLSHNNGILIFYGKIDTYPSLIFDNYFRNYCSPFVMHNAHNVKFINDIIYVWV